MSNNGSPEIELLDLPPECPERTVRRFAAEVLKLGGVGSGGAAVCIAFIDDDEIRRLNREFRGVDSPTDVLAFPADHAGHADHAPAGGYLGDVAVAVPTARRQAAELGHSALEELLTLVGHGLLHLFGHDHESDGGEMSRLESEVRERILPRFCREGESLV